MTHFTIYTNVRILIIYIFWVVYPLGISQTWFDLMEAATYVKYVLDKFCGAKRRKFTEKRAWEVFIWKTYFYIYFLWFYKDLPVRLFNHEKNLKYRKFRCHYCRNERVWNATKKSWKNADKSYRNEKCLSTRNYGIVFFSYL